VNFKTLKNTDLISNFENLVRSERKITAQILECIAEIDRRKLYEKKYTSLFEYLVKDFGYSPGAAMRRVDGARLLRELPEVTEKFENGSLTLSQANQIQRAAREFKKAKNESLSTDNKRDLLLQIENTTQKQTEQILATTLDLPVTPVQKETLHRDESVTLTITVTAEQMKVLQQAQKMISHCGTGSNWADTFTYLAEREVTRRKVVRKTPATAKPNVVTAVKTAAATPVKQARPAIPAAVRKTLLHANAKCAHKYPDGSSCQNQKFLQVDHIQSWSRGGSHDPGNLQVLCGTHNRLKFKQNA
jgi:HNH endonuclease/Domain of unknown function (DUF222)